MNLISLIKREKKFDVYAPYNKVSARRNPFFIDDWLINCQTILPYKICIIREFDLFDSEEMDQVIDYLQNKYQKVFVDTEAYTSLEPKGWSPYPKHYDKVIWLNRERPVPQHFSNELYWPAEWFRTIYFYSKVKSKIFNSQKIFNSVLRILAYTDWKNSLLQSLNESKLLDKITYAVGHKNKNISNSPCRFRSEIKNFNQEMPSLEQCQSYSLIVAEHSQYQITEKIWQSLYHKVPLFFHAGPIIQNLSNYGFEIHFDGISIDYSRNDINKQIIEQLKSCLPYMREIYEANRDRCEHNFQLVSNVKNINKLFEPLIADKL